LSLEDMEAKIKNLELQIRNLQDIRDIEKLQRAYGFYLERWMFEDIVDLFSDSPEVTFSATTGEFKGKERIRQYFEYMLPRVTAEFSHHLMQLSGVIDVDADGKTAKGRWFGFGLPAVPVGPSDPIPPVHGFLSGIYEMDYIKENEIWKFLKLRWKIIAHISPKDGWVRTVTSNKRLGADIPPDSYPVDYRLPIHFKHPVTGK
jgi:hypothetical protein